MATYQGGTIITTSAYDAGDRLTQIADSVSGTTTRTYDNLNRLTSETTPQGSVGTRVGQATFLADRADEMLVLEWKYE